jgi:hypothetical protein
VYGRPHRKGGNLKEAWLSEIQSKYADSSQDATGLFKTLQSIAEKEGLKTALAGLEECVFAKRRRWMENNPRSFLAGNDPVMQGFRMFYEHYLGLSTPRDGEVVATGENKITVRWRNRCPTLDACAKLGLDTRVVCRLAYDRPVQMMLEQIDPRLRFVRNYDAIRPHADACEETIELVEG